MKRFDGTEINPADAERFRRLVDEHRWIFAKTYAAFCPHEYTLRREWNREDFSWFAKFIRDNCFLATFGKSPEKKMYFIDRERGWYYFVIYADFDERGEVAPNVFGINRASLNQWELVETTNLFGTEYNWKRLPKERRKPIEDLPER